MSDITQILESMKSGDRSARDELLELVYQELRMMAARKMALENADHTLQPTALVHEAYLQLLGPDGNDREWHGRGHFFSAAAEAMRRILVGHARRKGRQKRGENPQRSTWDESKMEAKSSDELIAVHEALKGLEEEHQDLAELVKLRYFVGLTISETASVLGMSASTVNRKWERARVWLYCEISDSHSSGVNDNGLSF